MNIGVSYRLSIGNRVREFCQAPTCDRGVSITRLLCRAGSGIPPSGVGKLLEVRGADVRPGEINGIIDSRGDGYPLIAVGHGVDIEVFGDRCLVAVGCAVLADVSGAEIGGDYFQTTAPRGA